MGEVMNTTQTKDKFSLIKKLIKKMDQITKQRKLILERFPC